jgi:hypothetical protein
VAAFRLGAGGPGGPGWSSAPGPRKAAPQAPEPRLDEVVQLVQHFPSYSIREKKYKNETIFFFIYRSETPLDRWTTWPTSPRRPCGPGAQLFLVHPWTTPWTTWPTSPRRPCGPGAQLFLVHPWTTPWTTWPTSPRRPCGPGAQLFLVHPWTTPWTTPPAPPPSAPRLETFNKHKPSHVAASPFR